MARGKAPSPAQDPLAHPSTKFDRPDNMPPPFISAGVKADIEQFGEATDPMTGERFTRADLEHFLRPRKR